MRDQMDAEIWNAHHDQFSEYVDGVVAAARRSLRTRGTPAGRVPAQLFAGLFALSLTLTLIGASAA
jgi:hypothetical protein